MRRPSRDSLFRVGIAVVVVAGLGVAVALAPPAGEIVSGALAEGPAAQVKGAMATRSDTGGRAGDDAPPTSKGPLDRPSPVPQFAGRPGEMRVVPATRDVRVRAGEAIYTSDDDGLIAVPPGLSTVEVEVLGYTATPPVRRVEFERWSDGEDRRRREVDLSDTTPAIELSVQHRVQLDVGAAGPRTFDAVTGEIQLTPGSPQWIPARVPGVEGLVTYTDPTTGTTFLPTPEALWSVENS